MDSKMIRKGAAGILATVLLCFTGVFASFASADTETAENAETQGPKVESSITSCLINPDKKSVTVRTEFSIWWNRSRIRRIWKDALITQGPLHLERR